MKTRTGFLNTFLTLLPRAAFCALMLCAGCLRHRISNIDAYRLDDKGGVPMLVPVSQESSNSAEFQTAIVSFPAGLSEAQMAVRPDCAIEGSVFSLRANSTDHQSWIIRSPSVRGWDTLGREIDIDGEWRLFTRELARMYDRGCFPPGLPSQSVRSAIAKRIPLLASDVPVLMYSDQGERFVNLAPDMEIRIQKVLAPGTSAKSGSANAFQLQTAVFDVVPRGDRGLWLKRKPGASGSEKPSREMEEFLTLDQRFAKTPELRLFLQGISENQSQSGSILLGASNAMQLDVLTDLIRQRGPVACLDHPGSACIDLPAGSVSLFSFIWINGRRTTCPFGTSLASLLLLLPPPKQTEVLESIQVGRRLSLDRYAGIQFTRTIEGARELLLLPGDRLIGKIDGGTWIRAAEILTR